VLVEKVFLAVSFAVAGMLGGQPLLAMPSSRGEVKVIVAGSDQAFSAIAKSLTESLSFIAVAPQFERAASVDPRNVAENQPPAQPLLARLWIDAGTDREVILYITDAATSRVFVRRIALDQGLDTVAVEGLAFVAQSSLEALLTGKLIGMTRDDFEHSLDAATPPTVVRTPAVEKPVVPSPELSGANLAAPPLSSWHLGAGYELEVWDGATVRHALDLGLDHERGTLRFEIGLFGTWPIEFHSGDSGASLFSSGVRLGVSRPFAPTSHLRLVPGLGFAVELTRVHPELAALDAQPEPTYFAVDPTVRAVLGVEQTLGRWSLRGICGADILARPVHYVVTRPTATETVATPWRLRPFVGIVLSPPL
jgi:hypothetical protein